MAEDTVLREVLSKQIPVNREICRESSQFRSWIPACWSSILLNINQLCPSASYPSIQETGNYNRLIRETNSLIRRFRSAKAAVSMISESAFPFPPQSLPPVCLFSPRPSHGKPRTVATTRCFETEAFSTALYRARQIFYAIITVIRQRQYTSSTFC